MRRKWISVLVFFAAGVALVTPAVPVHAAPEVKPGWHKASNAEVKRLAKAIQSYRADPGLWWQDVPAKCLDVDRANSSREWFIYEPNCDPWQAIDSGTRLVKLGLSGALQPVAYGQFYHASCAEMARLVQQAGGPISVVKDLKVGLQYDWGRAPLCGYGG